MSLVQGGGMAQVDVENRAITLKVVYYGPARSGKTTNLVVLHELMNPATRGEMVTLDTKDDRTLYFDFLPVEFEAAGGFTIKMKLFTVPGQVMHGSTRKVVLAGVDAVAFVADSQRSSASANAYAWRDMVSNLSANGLDFEAIPKVVQFNKRDLPEIKPLADIREAWEGVPTVPAVATTGEGVLDTFHAVLLELYRGLDGKHGFASGFALSEQDFVKGVMRNFLETQPGT